LNTFRDKVVWITGASSGLGRAMAIEFASKGAIVAVSARRAGQLNELCDEILAAGGRASAWPCDVTRESEIESCVEAIILEYKRMDVAIANAGFGVQGRLEDLSYEDWMRQYSVNVAGLAVSIRHALPSLKKTKGRAVLIGSVAGFLPVGGNSAYSSSKAAVGNIGDCLQVELAGTGVSCTSDRPDNRPARLMWPADKAARVMIRAIHKRKRIFVYTGHGRFGAFMGRHFPGLTRLMMQGSRL
jgi:NAD(P)-dependent dehydrogenase (short-subunit alcohol dehydrogenase family)